MGMTELAGEYRRSIELLRFEIVDTRETERILHDYYN